MDYDPIVLAHARALLTAARPGATEYIDADLRDTGTILGPGRASCSTSRKPVAVTLLAILHAIPDADDPHAIVATLLDAVPPGSYLAVSHLGSDLLSQETREGSRAHRPARCSSSITVPQPRAGGAVLRRHGPG